MDHFSIPDRLDPISPAEPRQRPRFSDDQRRRQNRNPLPAKVEDDDAEAPSDDEDLHNVDELA